MSRISRHHAWMQMAEVAAMRSTCYRGNSGCFIVLRADVVSMGYNGPPSGEPHCRGNACELTNSGGCLRSIHAEANAIHRAELKLGRGKLHECDLYTTSAPCVDCAEHILNSGIKRMFYRYPYRVVQGLEMVRKYISVYRITPSGIIIAEDTGMICDDTLP